MILEVAILDVRPNQEAAFERDFAKASAYISRTAGYISHELQRCVEKNSRYILLARWETLEAHTEGFRNSSHYSEWKKLLHHYYDPLPTVEHYSLVSKTEAKQAPGPTARAAVAHHELAEMTVSDAFDVPAPEIQTQRLKLRRLSVDDAAAIYAYASDQEVARFTLWPPHANEEFTKSFLTVLTGSSILSWAIILEETQVIVGMIFFHSLIRQHRKVEIAFNLGRQFWNKGIATEAAAAVLNFAFGPLRLNRVEATCMLGNIGSRRVLEKLGMAREGTLRRSHCRHDGFHDMDLFSILRDEKEPNQSTAPKG